MTTHTLALALTTLLALTARASEPRVEPLDQAPAKVRARLQPVDAAVAALQQRLGARLQEELRQGGPARALAVCRDEAQALTAAAAREHGLSVGRTSARLRNPGNAPPPWAARLVADTVEARPLVVHLDGRLGLLRPIVTGAACVQCHGPAAALAPEVRSLLASAYPADRAVGFAEGDLRGWFWAETAAGEGDAQPAPDGAALFAQANPRCTVCHALGGHGNPSGAPLDGVGARLTREEIKSWIRTPAEMARQRGSTRRPAMVPYPEFSDQELDALAAYVAGLGTPAPRQP